MPSFNNESHINALRVVLAYVSIKHPSDEDSPVTEAAQILIDYLNQFDN